MERARKRTQRIEVRLPFTMDFPEWREFDRQKHIEKEREQRRQEQLRQEPELRKQQMLQERIHLQKEKKQQYIDGLNGVPNNGIILTNKSCFVHEGKCPRCQVRTQKEHVKIEQEWRRPFLLANLKRCPTCGTYYITPVQFYKLEEKADEKIHGRRPFPFVRPSNVDCEYKEDGTFLFMPSAKVNYQKYDENHLPPRDDLYYDMTDEEYNWLKMLYLPLEEEFPVQLRAKSFLGEAGYSTSESESRRHRILAQCVANHGKSRVINQLKSNMNLRMKQKNGNVRYANAINIWRGDIWFVEHKL